MRQRFDWLTPHRLWPVARDLLPPPSARPQGGGTTRVDDEEMFAAVAYILSAGVAWRSLPRVFGLSWQTAHRRFLEWSRAGVFTRLEPACVRHTDQGGEDLARWAAVLCSEAARRSSDAGAGTVVPAAGLTPSRRLRPQIRPYRGGEFGERLFGARNGAATSDVSTAT